MSRRLRDLRERHPLAVIVAAAVALRLVSAIWARGYGMLDDHFDVVEVAWRWSAGHPDWLRDTAQLRSLLYPGLHALLFRALGALGLSDPQGQMLVVRLLHAAWSMLTVVYGYRLAEALSDRRAARVAGMMLAAFWLMPYFSVRNLIESASQPPLVIGLWLLARPDAVRRPWGALAAGAWFGLAFTLRFPTALCGAAVVAYLLATRRGAEAWRVALGGAAAAALLVGVPDAIAHGQPFRSLLGYVAYNADAATVAGYPTGPWHRYVGLLLGVLIPPTSLVLLWGGLRSWRRLGLLFWPVAAFLVFHSAYPGKQERFLLPVLPPILVLTSLGWLADSARAPFWSARPRAVRALWTWFWVANGALLALYTPNYGKRSNVEAMTVLRAQPDLAAVVAEWSEEPQPFPTYYLGRDVPMAVLGPGEDPGLLPARLARAGVARPSHLVLMGQARVSERLARLGDLAAGAALLAVIEPGPVDRLLHRMNPRHNVNLVARVYRLPPEPPRSR